MEGSVEQRPCRDDFAVLDIDIDAIGQCREVEPGGDRRRAFHADQRRPDEDEPWRDLVQGGDDGRGLDVACGVASRASSTT